MSETCTFQGCECEVHCKSLCKRHYHRIAMANWRKKNPQKKYKISKEMSRIYTARWREKHHAELKKRAKNRYWKNVEKNRAVAREAMGRFRNAHPEKVKLIELRRSPESRARQRLKCIEYGKQNKDKKRHYSAKRRAAKKGAEMGDVSEIKKIYSRATFLRSVGFDVVVDHKTPLSKGGKHCASNLQIIPQTENNRKYCNENYEPIFIFP